MKLKLPDALASNVVARVQTWTVDATGIAGAGAVVYGVSLVYMPAGWILAGLMALGASWLLSGKGKRK